MREVPCNFEIARFNAFLAAMLVERGKSLLRFKPKSEPAVVTRLATRKLYRASFFSLSAICTLASNQGEKSNLLSIVATAPEILGCEIATFCHCILPPVQQERN